MLKWPGQVVLAVSCLYWTTNVTLGIENGTLHDYFEEVWNRLFYESDMVMT